MCENPFDVKHVVRDTIMDLLLGLAKERNRTMVVVTHDDNLARRGDRTLRIVDGLLA